MLHILGMILKIAGILLGSVLGICLLLLLLVLFVPLRYRVTGAYHGKPDMDVRLTWLFPFLSVRIRYDGEDSKTDIKILGLSLTEKRETAVLFRQKEMDAGEREETRQESDFGITTAEEPEKSEELEKPQEPEKNSFFKKIRQIPQKIKCTICSIYDKIKEIIQKKEQLQRFIKDEENREMFRLIKNQLIYLWRSVKPGKLSLSCHFGFDDPAVTGKALAAGAMLYPYYRNTIRLYPDFEQQVFEAEGFIKGRVRGISFARLLIRIWKNKRIRTMLYKYIK